MFNNKRNGAISTSTQGLLKAGCGFTIVGVLMFGIAFWNYTTEHDFVKTAKYTTGTVIDMAQEEGSSQVPGAKANKFGGGSGGEDTTYYYPIVSFVVDKHNYTFTSGSGSSPASYNIGQNVSVIYNPQNPPNANINTWSEKWLSVLIGSLFGGCFTGLGILLFILHYKIRNYYRNKQLSSE